EQLRLSDAAGGGAVAEVTLPARRSVDTPAPPVTALPEDVTLPEAPNGADAAAHGEDDAGRDRVHRAAIGTGIWVVCGLLWTLQSYAYLRIRNRLGHYTPLSLTLHDVTAALLWSCIAPIVFAATSRFPLTR